VSTRHQSYSKEFKEAIVTKILNRGDKTMLQICEEQGVNNSTVANWLQSRARLLGMSKKNSVNWSAEEKLKAVTETYSLSGEELGAYLRREGLHSQQLTQWRAEILESLTKKRKNASQKDERDVKIKSLEREVLRKDKALAEASALLILQKKVNLIWDKQDEEDS
jgi:transposase-like protein